MDFKKLEQEGTERKEDITLTILKRAVNETKDKPNKSFEYSMNWVGTKARVPFSCN